MNAKYVICYFLLAISIFFTACKKLLDQTPQVSATKTTVFTM